MKDKDKRILEAKTFDELLDIEYGPVGTPRRDKFECEAAAFRLAETIKEEREKAKLTPEDLAQRAGTDASSIQELENGNPELSLNALFRVFQALGRQLSFTVL